MRFMKTAVAVLAICSAGAIGLAAAARGQMLRWSESDTPVQRAYDVVRGMGGSRIGASVRDVDADDVKARTLTSESGAFISDVDDDAPASKAGLRAGDVVVEFDGERVRSARQLTRLVQETPQGRKVSVVVLREGSRMTFSVEPEGNGSPSVFTFATPPAPPAPPAPPMSPRAPRAPRAPMPPFHGDFDMPDFEVFRDGFAYSFGGGRLGISIQSLGDQLAKHFGAEDGVLVTEVTEDSAAAKAGLRAGDVITKVDGRDVDDTGDLMRAIGEAEGEIAIEIVRDRKAQTLNATLESAPKARTGRRII